jgi:hypothetical protein
VHGLRTPFQREPDFGVTSVNDDFVNSRSMAPIGYTNKCTPINREADFWAASVNDDFAELFIVRC